MSPRVRRIALVGVVVVVALALAAVFTLGVSVEDGPPDPESLQDRVQETNRSIDTYEATIRGTIDGPNESRTFAYRVAVDRPDRINVTYLAPENVSGDVVLYNRSGGHSYDASEDRLVRFEANQSARTDPLASLVEVITGNRSRFQGEDRLDGSSGVVLQYNAGGTGVGLRIGGSAPANRFTSANGSERVNVSVWVDPQRDLPVRFEQRFSTGNQSAVITARVTNLTTNVEFDPGRFRIPVTASTNVTERRIDTRQFQSREALADNVSMRVPDPSVPSEFSLQGAAYAELDGNRSVALTYRAGRRTLLVVARRPPTLLGIENATRVDLGGVEAYYTEAPTGSAVTWRCGNASYQVAGLLEKEGLIDVAESIGCPDTGEGRITARLLRVGPDR